MKYLLGEATDKENLLVERWLQADTANRAYYDELKKVWKTSLELAASSTIDENKAWQRFKQRVRDNKEGSGKPAGFLPRKALPWMRIAASLLIVTCLGIAGYWLYKQKASSQTILFATTGNVITDTLPDGSMVTLNKTSSLSYPSAFLGKKRAVKLTGEAFFDVKPDKQKPFVIAVNDIEVTVVGTSFNIKAANGLTEIIVETGIVRVTGHGETIELHPGERLQTLENGRFEKETVKDRLYNYYTTREFVCDDTPLWKLVDALNKAYQADIVIARKDLRNQRINIVLKNESLDRVLELISATLNVKVTRSDGQLLIE